MTSSGQTDRNYLRQYAIFALALLFSLGLVNWVVDPLQFYRRAAYRPVFSENQRYQNPGLAKNYDYETVVIGTSHAENFLPSHVERAFGEKTLKLAISGATAHEQYLILRKAIETGKPRHVLWALDYISFQKPARAVSRREGDFPLYLYREGPRTHWLYLFSFDSLGLSVDALLGRGPRDLDTLNTWYRDFTFGENRVLSDWRRRGGILDRVNRDPTRNFSSSTAAVHRSVRLNLLGLVRAHPEIRFDLFFPPYSALSYLADLRTWEHAFEERQAYKAFVVEQAASLSNARAFDFQAIGRITHDFRHYKDLEHYDLEISDALLAFIAAGRYRVTPQSHPAVLADQARQVEDYRARVCRPDAPQRFLCPRVEVRRTR